MGREVSESQVVWVETVSMRRINALGRCESVLEGVNPGKRMFGFKCDGSSIPSMDARRPLALFVGVGLVLVVALGAGLAVADENAGDANEADGEPFGHQVSTFAQASATDANATTERGLWEQRAVTADRPERALENRTAVIEQRIERIERKQAALEAQHENDSLAEPAYIARASQLRAQQLGLEADLNHTEATAQRVGVDIEGLDTLRQHAHNMTGPEVAAVARNISDAPRGPPEDRGPPEQSDDLTGPPDDAVSDEHVDTGEDVTDDALDTDLDSDDDVTDDTLDTDEDSD